MKRILPYRLAALGMFGILSLIILFHLLVLSGIIPFDIVWGGRLETHDQMLQFELVSIGVNLLMLMVVGGKAGILKWKIPPRVLTIALWVMVGLFALNTIGNLFSTNTFEKWMFTPLTILLSLFSLRLAIEPEKIS